MGSRMRLEELGAEVSASLDKARACQSQDTASRVREKLMTRQKLRVVESVQKKDATGTADRFLSNRRAKRGVLGGSAVGDQLVRGTLGGLAVAATIAITAFFAWPGQTPERAQKDPVLSFTIGPARDANNGNAPPQKQEGTVGAFIAASNAEMPVTFSDGSNLRLEPAARVRVAEVANNGARVHVESGTVHVSVVHREATKWAVEAGPFEVRVTGTKFDVAYDPVATGLVVKLDEGSVFVRGCGLGDQGRKLTAGEELRVACDAPADKKPEQPEQTEKNENNKIEKDKPPTKVAEREKTEALPDAPIQAPPAAPVVAVAPKAEKVDSARVVTLARRGAHTEALQAAEANGFATTCDALQGPDLLVLADAARYAGRFDRATEALETTRRRFSGSDSAATAAFELGRIEMDVRRDLPGAGDHFETYLRERPNGGLAREALGRAIEARNRAGDGARAERLAVRYLAAYPDGPHAKLARKLTSPEPSSP